MTDETYAMVVPADWVSGPPQGSWTYEEYAKLGESAIYEIVRGVLVTKPMPDLAHQRISGKIFFCLYEQINARKQGEVFYAPIDVYFAKNEVFQPDLLVVLNEHLDRIQEKRIEGALDLVVEVASPGSWLHDRINKYVLYQQAGVPEYWFVDSKKKTVEVFALENDAYASLGLFQGEQPLLSRVVPDVTVPVSRFFE